MCRKELTIQLFWQDGLLTIKLGHYDTKQEIGLYTVPAKGGQAAIVLNEGTALQPRWSPDSKKIYYTKENEKSSWTSKTLAVVSAEGGKGQIIPLKKDPLIYFPYQYQGRQSGFSRWKNDYFCSNS